MTPTEREEAIRKARYADEVAEHIPFDEAEAQIFEDWRAAETVDAREALHSELHALRRVKARVQALINVGRQAANEKQQDSNNG